MLEYMKNLDEFLGSMDIENHQLGLPLNDPLDSSEGEIFLESMI